MRNRKRLSCLRGGSPLFSFGDGRYPYLGDGRFLPAARSKKTAKRPYHTQTQRDEDGRFTRQGGEEEGAYTAVSESARLLPSRDATAVLPEQCFQRSPKGGRA